VSGATDFDAGRLERFLRGRLPDLDGTMVVERVSGGQSNPTYFLTYPGRSLVLRKRPNGPTLPSAHAVDREFRVLDALARTDVPVPRTVLFHASDEVVGTPFYVMERVAGRVFEDCALPGLSPDQRRAVYLSMAETLARLHAVDPVALGLGDYGRPATTSSGRSRAGRGNGRSRPPVIFPPWTRSSAGSPSIGHPTTGASPSRTGISGWAT